MKCPRCQHENPTGMKFCGEYAAPLASTCPSCGGANPPENKFCGQCAAPLIAEAQPTGKVYRIGFLSYLGCGTSLDPNGSFRKGLRELGYVEGRNLAIECRDARGQVDRFADLTVELVGLKSDVLVAEGTPASGAAKQVTTTIPIMMVGVADLCRAGSSPAWRDREAMSRGPPCTQPLRFR